MPFRGKPSPGCEACRRRKTKCDQKRPQCDNCVSHGRQCPGYRNLLDLMFLDETVKTARKSKAAKRSPPSSTSSSQIHTPSPDHISIVPDPEEHAITYFFRNYVPYAHPRKIHDIHDGNGCLVASIKALGATGIEGGITARPRSLLAQKFYVEAISLTNAALRSDSLATKDSTLLAINILGIFETVTSRQKTMEAWRAHVRGASSLLRLRGAAQFSTALGCWMYLQTAHTLVLSCLGYHIHLPADAWEIQAIASRHVSNLGHPAWQFHLMSYRFVDFCADDHLVCQENAPEMLRQAMDLENEAHQLMTSIQSQAIQAAQAHNSQGSTTNIPQIFLGFIRAMRVRIMKAMLSVWALYLTDGHADLTEFDCQRFHLALSMRTQLLSDTIASIPELLDVSATDLERAMQTEDFASISSTKAPLTPNYDLSPWKVHESNVRGLPFVRASGGHIAHWHLFSAGVADDPNGPFRTQAIRLLRAVPHLTGVHQALALADHLEMMNERGISSSGERN